MQGLKLVPNCSYSILTDFYLQISKKEMILPPSPVLMIQTVRETMSRAGSELGKGEACRSASAAQVFIDKGFLDNKNEKKLLLF